VHNHQITYYPKDGKNTLYLLKRKEKAMEKVSATASEMATADSSGVILDIKEAVYNF